MIYNERISQLRNFESSYRIYEENVKKHLKDVINIAEEFLKTHKIGKGLLLQEPDKLNKIAKKLNITIKVEKILAMDGCKFHHHKNGVTNSFKDTVYVPPNIKTDWRFPHIEVFACALTLKFLGLQNQDEEYFLCFEFPSYSMQFTIVQKAFIYSLLVPYTEYEKTFKIFCNNIKKEKSLYHIQTFNEKWLQYCSEHFASYLGIGVMPCIISFYQSLFFDNLNEIWKKEILSWSRNLVANTEYEQYIAYQKSMIEYQDQKEMEQDMSEEYKRYQEYILCELM